MYVAFLIYVGFVLLLAISFLSLFHHWLFIFSELEFLFVFCLFLGLYSIQFNFTLLFYEIFMKILWYQIFNIIKK